MPQQATALQQRMARAPKAPCLAASRHTAAAPARRQAVRLAGRLAAWLAHRLPAVELLLLLLLARLPAVELLLVVLLLAHPLPAGGLLLVLVLLAHCLPAVGPLRLYRLLLRPLAPLLLPAALRPAGRQCRQAVQCQSFAHLQGGKRAKQRWMGERARHQSSAMPLPACTVASCPLPTSCPSCAHLAARAHSSPHMPCAAQRQRQSERRPCHA